MGTLREQIRWYGRGQMVLAGLLALFVAGLWVLGLHPASLRMSELRDQIEARRGELSFNRNRAKNLPIVTMEVEHLRRKLERYGKKMPHGPELGQFIKDLTQISQRVSLRKMQSQPGVPRRNPLFAEMPINLKFEGDFASVFSFLQEAEAMPRLTRVKNMTVKATQPGGGQVQVELAMSIYFSEG